MATPKKPKNIKPLTTIKVKKHMEALGTYRAEFDPIICLYCDLLDQYIEINGWFTSEGYRFESETAQGVKKAPIVTTLESLRKDILNYASQLGLTPTGLKRIKDGVHDKGKEQTPLEKALGGLSRL